jgi:hypothetical protein
MTHDLSSLRSQLHAVGQQLHDLLETFLGREPLLPGSLYTLRRRCGKPTCHCAHGTPHASTVLSYRGHGRPQNITPSAAQLPDVRQLTDAYRRFRQARSQLLRLKRQLLTLIDRLAAARVREGQRRLQRLRAASSPTRSWR